MRTIIIPAGTNLDKELLEMVRSAYCEFQNSTGIECCTSKDIRIHLLPWILNTYGILFTPDTHGNIYTAEIYDEKLYSWFILKHSSSETYENYNF